MKSKLYNVQWGQDEKFNTFWIGIQHNRRAMYDLEKRNLLLNKNTRFEVYIYVIREINGYLLHSRLLKVFKVENI